MPTAAWVALAGVLGAALAAFGTWAAVRRQRSGRVDTSEAKDLWDESKAIREELRAESSSLRLRLADAEVKLAETLQKLAETNMHLMTAKNQAAELREEVLELRRLCGRTNEDVAAVHRELTVIKSDTPEREEQRRMGER
jgi:predicted metal-dependent hydrolase